jgi:hypothetical protein
MAWLSIVGMALPLLGAVIVMSVVFVSRGQAGKLSPGLLQDEDVIGTPRDPHIRDRLRQSDAA